MPGGFHPFHAGHYALYKSAIEAFPDADVYVAATNDQSERPFPFGIKEKLAKLAGVAPGRFVQVKSPFQAKEITQNYDPNSDVLIFVRSEKDKNESPKPGGTKKDGSPAYFQPYTGKDMQPFSKHAYFAYLPTVTFGPGIQSATEIRKAWPTLDDRRKTAMVMSLYPATQKNPKLAQNVVQLLDVGMGGQQGVTEGSDGWISNPTKWKEAVLQAHGPDVTFKNYSHPGQPGKRSVNAINADGKQVGVYQRHNKMGMVQPNMQDVAEAEYNPDTFVGKKGTYKGYGITQECPHQWGISSSARKFSTLNAAKRHIDKNLVAEQGVAEGSEESYIIVRTDSEGKKDVFAGNFDTYERAQKELDACLAHPLHTKYKQKFEINRRSQDVVEGSLNEFAVDGFGDSGDKRSKLLASVGRLLDGGNKVDWQVPGQMGHVTRVQNDGITMKRWKMPHSRMSFFLPMYDDSRDNKYTIKMVAPKHYAVVSAEQGVAEENGGVGGGFGTNYPGTYEQENGPFTHKGGLRLTSLTTESVDYLDEK